MLASRNFVYRHFRRGAHPKRVALPASNPEPRPAVFSQPNAPASSSTPSKTDSNTLSTVGSTQPTLQTSQPSASPSPSPSSVTPLAIHVASSTASAISSSSLASASVLVSSTTAGHSSIASTPLALTAGSSPDSFSTPISVIPYTYTAGASSLVPSATPSAGTSSGSGTNTGAIVGGIAGTLVGIAALAFFLMWCMRRQRDRDLDDFDAQAFKRQSAVLMDDPVEPPRLTHNANPRPPTMIERHNASPALAGQAGYGGLNFYGGYGGYGQQPYPPEMAQLSGPQQAFAAPPMGYNGYDDPRQQVAGQYSMGYADYNSGPQLARQASNAHYLTRQPSGYTHSTEPPSSHDPNGHYVDLNRFSVTPYQAAQYADISRRLGTPDPNHQAPPADLPDDPLPSPFDNITEATPASGTTLQDNQDPVSAATSAPTHGNVHPSHQRPTTIYEEGDAYSGI